MAPISREYGTGFSSQRPVAVVADVTDYPAHPADVAQSRLFAAFLEAEIVELEREAAKAERMWRRRVETSAEQVLPDALARQRGRIAEAQGLLARLHRRFPRSGPVVLAI